MSRRNVNLLCDYEHEVDACVRRYIDQLLEEVEEAQAQVLRRADSEVIQRDSSLRYAHTNIYASYRVLRAVRLIFALFTVICSTCFA